MSGSRVLALGSIHEDDGARLADVEVGKVLISETFLVN